MARLTDEERAKLRQVTDKAIAQPAPVDGPNPAWHEAMAAFHVEVSPYKMRDLLNEVEGLRAELDGALDEILDHLESS